MEDWQAWRLRLPSFAVAATRVFERRRDVGARFHGDFQGLENWSTEKDVLEELASFGIETAFDHTPVPLLDSAHHPASPFPPR